MTAAQMKYEFEVGYDRITNFDAPGYTNKEISTFLTKAQEEFVLDLYRNGNHYKEEFKKSLNFLKGTPAEITSFVTGPYPNSYAGVIPTDVLVVYNERANVDTGVGHELPLISLTDVAVKPIDDDFYHANKRNPFKKPSVREIWRLDDFLTTTKRHVYVIEGNSTLSKVYVHYYKKPTPIIVEDSTYIVGDGEIDGENWVDYTADELACGLDSITHREIVDRAVKLAYAALQDEKGFQISTAKEQEKKV